MGRRCKVRTHRVVTSTAGEHIGLGVTSIIEATGIYVQTTIQKVKTAVPTMSKKFGRVA